MTSIDSIDPRIQAHLAPDEQVLWQGHPTPDTFFGPAQLVPPGLLMLLGNAVGAGAGDALTQAVPGAMPHAAASAPRGRAPSA